MIKERLSGRDWWQQKKRSHNLDYTCQGCRVIKQSIHGFYRAEDDRILCPDCWIKHNHYVIVAP